MPFLSVLHRALLGLALLLAGCTDVWNNPYTDDEAGEGVLYSAFVNRPKHLDPVQAYSEDEATFLYQIYEPPLQYHYLKRPYALEPAAAETMPRVRLIDAAGNPLAADAPSKLVAHILDLLPRSGREAEGCLLVTYSLLSEAHTTYLAVADKGLRPVALVRPRGPGGQRTKAGSLKSSPKIRWEAGPAATEPDWSLLLKKGESLERPPPRLAGPMRAFARFAERN